MMQFHHGKFPCDPTATSRSWMFTPGFLPLVCAGNEQVMLRQSQNLPGVDKRTCQVVVTANHGNIAADIGPVRQKPPGNAPQRVAFCHYDSLPHLFAACGHAAVKDSYGNNQKTNQQQAGNSAQCFLFFGLQPAPVCKTGESFHPIYPQTLVCL